MNDVKETLVHDGTPLERLLLSSARDERPSEDIQRRLMAPLLATPTQAPPPNGPGGPAATTVAGAKWAVGIVSALSMAGAIGWMTLAPRLSELGEHASERPPTTPTAQPLLEGAEPAPPRQSEPAPMMPPGPARSETPARESEPATPPPASPLRHRAASTLDSEMRLLDQAREALSGKDHARALAILGRYEQKYPKGILRPEATVLRVSALSAAGQASKANDLRKDFLDENPTSAHRRRLAEELPSWNAAQGSSPTTAH